MKNLKIIFLCLLSFSVFAAEKPTKAHLISSVAERLPKHLKVSNLEIKASENKGSEVEPIIYSRVVFTFLFTEDAYEKISVIEGVTILKKTYSKGTRKKTNAYSTSKLYFDKWKTTYNVDRSTDFNEGKPRSYFPKSALLKNDPKVKSLIASAKKKAEKEEAARIANTKKNVATLEKVFAHGVTRTGIIDNYNTWKYAPFEITLTKINGEYKGTITYIHKKETYTYRLAEGYINPRTGILHLKKYQIDWPKNRPKKFSIWISDKHPGMGMFAKDNGRQLRLDDIHE